MTDPTPSPSTMDAVTLSTERLLIALSTQASFQMLPQSVDILLEAYSLQLEPAEA